MPRCSRGGKHRQGNGAKLEHAVIPGLREWMMAPKPDNVKSILPGRMWNRKHSAPFNIREKYRTLTGIKYLASSGHIVQEVFVVLNQSQPHTAEAQDAEQPTPGSGE